jgi:hypothetical protein
MTSRQKAVKRVLDKAHLNLIGESRYDSAERIAILEGQVRKLDERNVELQLLLKHAEMRLHFQEMMAQAGVSPRSKSPQRQSSFRPEPVENSPDVIAISVDASVNTSPPSRTQPVYTEEAFVQLQQQLDDAHEEIVTLHAHIDHLEEADAEKEALRELFASEMYDSEAQTDDIVSKVNAVEHVDAVTPVQRPPVTNDKATETVTVGNVVAPSLADSSCQTEEIALVAQPEVQPAVLEKSSSLSSSTSSSTSTLAPPASNSPVSGPITMTTIVGELRRRAQSVRMASMQNQQNAQSAATNNAASGNGAGQSSADSNSILPILNDDAMMELLDLLDEFALIQQELGEIVQQQGPTSPGSATSSP